MRKQPHIIIINPDEMRWDSMGHTGNPAARTFFIDRLVQEEAVSFDRAYCQNPVCVPSRCSFLTGLYPHVYGHRTMQHLLHEHETSLFKELKGAGYYVWMNARNDFAAGQIKGLAVSHADEVYYGNDTEEQVKKSATEMGIGGGKETYPYSHFGGRSMEGMDRDWEDTRAAVERIRNAGQLEKSLCLFLGWMNPHPPYQVEEPYYSSIDRKKVPLRIRYEDTEGKSMMIGRLHELVRLGKYTEEQWRELRAVYLAQCAKVDAMLQAVCEALKEAGMYEDSAIFFLSDHGDFCGDYGLPEKAQNSFEDCLTRVPLVIKPPEGCPVDPGRTEALAELVDFYATVLDYAGIESSHDHFGRSLRNVIADRKHEGRAYVCAEGGRLKGEIQCDEWHAAGPDGPQEGTPYWPKQTAQKDDLTHEKGTMICDGRYKFIQRHSGLHELYDLKTDPGECINLYGRPEMETVALEFRLKLGDWYQQTCDIVPREMDSRFTVEAIWANVKKFCPPDMREEVKRNIFEENWGIREIMQKIAELSAKGRGGE